MAATKLEKYHNVVVDLVKKCGDIFRQGYHENKAEFETKCDFYDLVTVYDKQIEVLLVEGIKKEFPECKFIGEEDSAASKILPELTDDPTWIIDPIDGTTNFIRRIPLCCISVGLSIKKELVLGIVYNPITDEMFTAYKGNGAYLNGKKISVSNRKAIKDSIVAYEISMIHSKRVRDKNVKRLTKLASNATGTRTFGSAAVTLCLLAKGIIDVFHVEDLQPWDIAAGAVILREAGGVIVKSDGSEFDIMNPYMTSASTPELLTDVMALIKEANEIKSYTIE
ncbi:uncharacterized protein LOC129918253 [Episyrphus balteatus]|uniref:uncharacterized protein LOC129918253 n=1 Tax=Episyrphus balteatus TaxID=286459 RepID=UPI0024869337|nr:uncharacterized protein LOC129918253 [Episyrphus balteatus]